MSKEESKQVGIDWSGFPKSTQEEVKLRQLFKNRSNCYAEALDLVKTMDENCFIETIKEWQQERSYSEEEVYNLLCKLPNYFKMTIPQQAEARKEWFEQFKKK